MKLSENTEEKRIKGKNEENMRQLEITEVILIYYNLVNNIYQFDS